MAGSSAFDVVTITGAATFTTGSGNANTIYFLITHKPQPVLAAGKALELFGHWPSKGVAS